MTVVGSKYDKLAPRASYLQDVVILAQAWKKTHTYIRRYNWYADTLELDCSAVLLDEWLAQWAASVADGTYRTGPAWLVPAPKSGLWAFSSKLAGGWAPYIREDDDDKPVLRPLAHIGIREQTVATAVMLCLADCVESAQGDTSLPPGEAVAKSVFSYGNRLFCTWDKSGAQARFSWGNSDTYSRYFQDYQRFVERPTASAIRADSAKDDDEIVYIAKLDITAFFDNVDIDTLVDRLREEYDSFIERDPSYPSSNQRFWTLAHAALKFEWRDEDLARANLFRDGKLPTGLPQGLVSSGFFANAYLLQFDRAVGKALGRRVHKGHEFRVHDYCRYVDDLRLVVTVRLQPDKLIDEVVLAKDISEWIQGKLKAHTTSSEDQFLHINERKTALEILGEVGSESRTAARMKLLQQQLSGPFDMEALQHVEAGLSGLLSLAELGLLDETSPTSAVQGLRLASVAKTKLEVRDDTLTRFSAYRLTRSLRLRRSITDFSEASDGVSGKEELLHDFESAARRLVAAWAVNPSLVQVLRYALDIFPSVELLETVSQALTSKLRDGTASEYEERVVFYVLAEIFKAGATETGRRNEQDTAFSAGDVSRYRVELAGLAQTVLEFPTVPWYVQQQASLLLASVGQATSALSAGPELLFHRALHGFISKRPGAAGVKPIDELVTSLVGHQLLSNESHYVAWFKKFSSGRGRPVVSTALRLVGETEPGLFARLASPRRGVPIDKADLAPKYLSRYAAARWMKGMSPLPPRKWLSLATVITHPSAPFSQENALLQLALLLGSSIIRSTAPALLNPLNVELRSYDWSKLNDPRSDVLELRLSPTSRAHDPIYATPPWCPDKDAWMYAIGRVLRAAATGESDFTARHWLLHDDAGWYQGIRSTWQKRRMGMLHTAEALGGTSAAITPWFSGMLIGLLRWPGIAQRGGAVMDGISTPREFAALVRERLKVQTKIYGESSDLPIYRYPVFWNINRSRGLRVALVQGLMPMQVDFAGGLDGLDVPGYRERHRNHTAALLHLAARHLEARDYVLGRPKKPHVDLVIFPELTIHVDDQDLMRAFSDSTGAMLFYGLLGAKKPGTVEPINAGRWLVPQRTAGRRSWVIVDQGKWYLTKDEQALGVKPWRPYQVVIELRPESGDDEPFRISGSICYDATDLALAADLRDESHMYVVAAMNKDVKTFDGMVAALRYHMYQHVLIANIGEFGGSTAQAPFDLEHRRLIAHSHGSEQIAVSVFDVRMDDFGPKLEAANDGTPLLKKVVERIGKTPPAGLNR